MSAAALAEVAGGRGAALAEPHHDGSDVCVLERPDEAGGEATVRVRVPHAAGVDRVVLRYVRDGEPSGVEAVVDEDDGVETWWRASFPLHRPDTPYRWLLAGRDGAWTWLNGLGPIRHEPADADDFVLGPASLSGPDWHLRSVVYEVFPDRFAASGAAREAPPWAVRRRWDEPPARGGSPTSVEWYGGDLPGLELRLDHVEQLGADVLYLTPFFPAGSTHRYDASAFDRVDPLLGGDGALASLTRAAHERGMRVLGDLTLNHCGAGHPWFTAARADEHAAERALFVFDETLPLGYASWLGVPSLPKLDWSSAELRARMRDAVQRWLRPPFALDGWRIDVANMIGRYGELDLNREAARETRAAALAARPDALLVAEHAHDFRPDVRGDGWHGVMNYAGFLRPVWTWLRGDDPAPEQRRSFWGLPVGMPRAGGREAVRTMRVFRAGVPWEATLHSWTLLDSHDTPRFRTIAGSRERHLVGLGLQLTSPGVPMVFAGDELGLEGAWGEDARRTMPWDRPERWDAELLAAYRGLIALRRSSDALARGGLRYVHVSDDAIAYLRETRAERLLCLAARAPHEPVRLPRGALGGGELEALWGGEAVANGDEVVLPSDGPAFHVWRVP